MRYRKRPIIVTAEQLKTAQSIKTFNGTLECLPGDYLVTGIHGEQYPVDQDIFHATFDPVADGDEEVTKP